MKTIKQSFLFFIFLTIILGGIYPLTVTMVTKVLFPEKVSGGFITYEEKIVGADLIGQEFASEKYFWGRPSAANFNASASSGSNYSLTHPDLQKAILKRKEGMLDYDLLTASASGLDPDISVESAHLQVARVAKNRGLDAVRLKSLVNNQIIKRQWGFLGEERVNVLKLNLALEKLSHE